MTSKPEPIIEDQDIDLEATAIHVNGERFTDADGDAITEHLTGRQRSMANLVPGRKSLTGEIGKQSPVLNVRLSEDIRDGLREVADIGGVSVSKYARQALDDAIAYYVLWEQTFDGDHWQWVRIEKALPLEQAESQFEHFRGLAATHGYRRVQIRRGRDNIVKEWSRA